MGPNDTKAPRQASAQLLCQLIDANKGHPLVAATVLGKILPAVQQFVRETDARLAALERAQRGDG